MNLSFESIISDLKKKIYHPIYFLFGDEAFYIDKIVEIIENKVLTESEKAFNQQILYGKDVQVGQVIESAMRLPMMANYQVVIIKEAQQLENIEELSGYLKNPTKSTILVLAYKHKNPDKRKTFFKEIIKHPDSVALESKAIRDYEVVDWIRAYVQKKGLNFTPKAIEILAEFLGNDMSKIVNEVDKLLLIKGDDKNINEDDIEKNIGASKDYNIFELTNALGHRDSYKSSLIIKYFMANPKNIFLPAALGLITAFFQKVWLTKFTGAMSDKELAKVIQIHPFIAKEYKKYARNYTLKQLENIFILITDYDAKSKGLGNKSLDHAELFEEFVLKLFTL